MIRAELLDAAGDLGLRPGVGDTSFRIGGAKVFVDGAFGPRTALLSSPYEDSSSCGSMHLDERDLETKVRNGARVGWQMCVHAIGDAAVESVANVLAAHPPAPREPVPPYRALLPHFGEHDTDDAPGRDHPRTRNWPSYASAPPISSPRSASEGWETCTRSGRGWTPVSSRSTVPTPR